MRKIIRPQIVALDSSQLGAVARDKFSDDETRRERAAAFEHAFEARGSVLLLCRHHIEELLSHGDQDVVEHRIQFIRSLPLVAVTHSFTGNGLIGSMIDLQAKEAAIAFKEPKAGVTAIRDEVARLVFRLERGADIIAPFIQNWSILKDELVRQGERNREIIAISRSEFVDISESKIFDLIKGRVRGREEIAGQLREFHRDLTQDIRRRGDKRIPNPERSSAEFLEYIWKLAMESSNMGNPVLKILMTSGVSPSEIGPHSTVRDVGNLATFRKKLLVLNEHLGLPWPELKARVTEERLPSGVIQCALARFRPDTLERKGSDLTDGYLACLSAYAGVTYVDKRMHEAFRIARQKSKEFSAVVRRVEKAGGYEEIIEQLSARIG